jgi:hypothetical protein
MAIKRMLDADYFKLDAVSNSKLSRLAKCPKAMTIEFETTPAMLTGTLAHALILEGPEVFHQRYIVAPDVDKRTKEGKTLYQSFCEANKDKTVITLDQLQAVAGMAESVASHPACREILADGQPELAVTWEEEGLDAKAKCDWVSSAALIDLKTTQNSEYSVFSKTIVNSGYHRQMAFYKSGLAANCIHPEHCLIIAVESKAPFTVNVYSVENDLLEAGEGQYKELLRKYAQIKDMDVLPSYTEAGIQSVYCPAWMKEVKF